MNFIYILIPPSIICVFILGPGSRARLLRSLDHSTFFFYCFRRVQSTPGIRCPRKWGLRSQLRSERGLLSTHLMFPKALGTKFIWSILWNLVHLKHFLTRFIGKIFRKCIIIHSWDFIKVIIIGRQRRAYQLVLNK